MKCSVCKQGITEPGFTVVTLQRGEHTLIFKGVPADVCENCGEYYLSDDVANRLYNQAEQALKHGAEVEIGHYISSGAN
jgi:YgiT-type zinc finger domain-containing protein